MRGDVDRPPFASAAHARVSQPTHPPFHANHGTKKNLTPPGMRFFLIPRSAGVRAVPDDPRAAAVSLCGPGSAPANRYFFCTRSPGSDWI
ncbi:protein of unknown function [Pararobbsia alpina]